MHEQRVPDDASGRGIKLAVERLRTQHYDGAEFQRCMRPGESSTGPLRSVKLRDRRARPPISHKPVLAKAVPTQNPYTTQRLTPMLLANISAHFLVMIFTSAPCCKAENLKERCGCTRKTRQLVGVKCAKKQTWDEQVSIAVLD